jgi:hypothetical protein
MKYVAQPRFSWVDRFNPTNYLAAPRHNFWSKHPDRDITKISSIGVELEKEDLNISEWSQNYNEEKHERRINSVANRFILDSLPLPFTKEDVVDWLSQHGSYIRYIQYSTMLRAAEQIFLDNPDLSAILKQLIISDQTNYPGISSIDDDDIQRVPSTLAGFTFDRFLHELIGDDQAVSAIDTWYLRECGKKPCIFCEYEFDRNWMIGGYFVGTLGHQICFGCKRMKHPKGEELNQCIRDFIDWLGYIPNSGLEIQTMGMQRAISPEKFPELCRRWMQMGGTHHVRNEYGTWFHGVSYSGLLPDGVQIGKRGIKCLAQDGHVCRSLSEQRIDNWLSNNGLEHECEPHYPHDEVLNPMGLLKADWKVGDTYIEYFGMSNDASYAQRMVRKQNLANKHSMKLLELHPGNLSNLDDLLGILIP